MKNNKFRFICEDIEGNRFTLFKNLTELQIHNLVHYGRIQKIVAKNQYIGRKDKEDKELYVGDIVDNGINIGVIYFDEDKLQYRIKYSEGHTGEICLNNGEINVVKIGNKYEDSHLLV